MPSAFAAGGGAVARVAGARSAGVWRGGCGAGRGDLLGAARLRQSEAAPMEGNAAAQVGQRERALAVATVRRPDELEERLVLGDGEQLPRTEHPAGRCKVPCEHPNLPDIWLRHLVLLSSATGRFPGARCRSSG